MFSRHDHGSLAKTSDWPGSAQPIKRTVVIHSMLYGLLILVLAGQILFGSAIPREWRSQLSPAIPPSSKLLNILALGEHRAGATLLTYRLQSFDVQGGKNLSIRTLDMAAVRENLARISELAPRSSYPLFLAARIYAPNTKPAESRRLLEWVAERFKYAPEHHWPWLAHAVHTAKHRLKDSLLARKLAQTLRIYGQHSAIPQWARDLEFFLLKDLNELEAAQSLLGGLIQSKQLTEPRVLDVMLQEIEEIKRNMRADRRP